MPEPKAAPESVFPQNCYNQLDFQTLWLPTFKTRLSGLQMPSVFFKNNIGFLSILLSFYVRENWRRLKKCYKKNQRAYHPPRNMDIIQFELCSPSVLEGSFLSQAFKYKCPKGPKRLLSWTTVCWLVAIRLRTPPTLDEKVLPPFTCCYFSDDRTFLSGVL